MLYSPQRVPLVSRSYCTANQTQHCRGFGTPPVGSPPFRAHWTPTSSTASVVVSCGCWVSDTLQVWQVWSVGVNYRCDNCDESVLMTFVTVCDSPRIETWLWYTVNPINSWFCVFLFTVMLLWLVFDVFMLNMFDYISCVSPIFITYMCIYRYWNDTSYYIANNSSLNFIYSYGTCVAAKSKQTLFLICD